MKRIVAIGFLIVLVLQIVGFYAYFGSRLLVIRKEMRAALAVLPKEKLERLVLSFDEFSKLDSEENEVELSGKMYDIAKIEKTKTGYILFGLHDEHEDNLLSLLDEMIKRSTNDKKPVPSQFAQFFALVFLPTQMSFGLCIAEPIYSPTEYINSYQSVALSIQAPPPWA